MELLAIFETIVTYIYVPIACIMVLIILLQAGKGGMGTALGGGASQSVFGGGGASAFMESLTKGFAAAFMLCVLFLAYASAHSGSSALREGGEETEEIEAIDDGSEINYERIGPNPLVLAEAGSESEPPPSIQPLDAPPVLTPDASGAPVDPSEEAAPADAAPSDAAPSDAAPADAAPSEAAPADAAPSEAAPDTAPSDDAPPADAAPEADPAPEAAPSDPVDAVPSEGA